MGGGQLGRWDTFDFRAPAQARSPAARLRAVAVLYTVALWEAGAAEPEGARGRRVR